MHKNPQFARQVTFIRHRTHLLMVILCGYIVRIISLDFQGMWRDEVDQWRFALSPLDIMFSRFSEIGWNGPLYPPILRMWITVAGESVFAMRYFSLLCGVLVIPLLYVLSCRLINQKVALWASLLITFSPYFVWYAQELKMYTWVPMLLLLAFYGLERACHQPSPSWLWWGVTLTATCLAFYSHILAAFVIPVLFLWFWLIPDRHPRAWVGGAITFSLLTLPYIPMFIWQYPLLFIARETGYPAYSFGEMMTALVIGWTSGISMGTWAGGTLARLIPVFSCTLAVLGLVSQIATKKRNMWKMLVWLFIPFLGLWALSLRSPMFTDRYLIWLAPAFYILMALGISLMEQVKRGLMLCIGVAAVIASAPGLYSQAVYPLKPQFDDAATYIMNHSTTGDLLLFQIPYNAQVFRFYTPNQVYPWEEAPYTNWQNPDGSYQVDERYVHQEMSQILVGYDRVWLVYSEVALWDNRELVKMWLDNQWYLVDQKDLQGVTVYLYRTL